MEKPETVTIETEVEISVLFLKYFHNYREINTRNLIKMNEEDLFNAIKGLEKIHEIVRKVIFYQLFS